MPGIAGIVGPRSPDECQRLVQTMVASMMHERTYSSGTHLAPNIGVYGGWIAHRGSFADRQCGYTSPDGSVLLFSGECHPPIEQEAPAIRSNEQAELDGIRPLLHHYDAEGPSFVAGLNGLFSGLLIEPKRRRALLFNDRFGSERIYYFEKEGTTYFATEAKALLSILPELRVLDDQGVAQFLNYGSTIDGRTMFRAVRLLPGGSLWQFEGGPAWSKRRYFLPESWESLPSLSQEAFEAQFVNTFRKVLPPYFATESSIGISITGGLDTRMIMACFSPGGIKPVCYTFGGLTGETLDARLGARVARSCGLEHHILRIGADFISNFGDYVDRTVLVTDGCAGAVSAHEIYFTRLAAQLAPIRLTGNFGSEILRSMSTFEPTGLADSLVDPGFRGLLDTIGKEMADRQIHPVTHAAFCEIPWHLFGTLAAGRSQLVFRTPYLDNEIVKLAYQAPASSRESSIAALKLINDSNRDLGAIPTDRGLLCDGRGPLYSMRRLFAAATFKLDYLDKEGLPHWLSPFDPLLKGLSSSGLLGLHKFLPYRGWFRHELAGYVREVLSDPVTQRSRFWNSRFLATIVADHIAGRRNYVREINAVLTLEAVDRLLIRASTPDTRPAAKAQANGEVALVDKHEPA
jgi:asparagine synthase (glutamine-hydrolysing)